ncbi:MAG: hypothetical protein U9Q74_01455 [Gemmatimonadota bacterium]|nr:hypothetical protein [Gemmatimonadota bacterium]
MLHHAKAAAAFAAVITGAIAAAGAESSGISIELTVVISVLASAVGGAVVFGAVQAKVASAHHRITEEKSDREKADMAIKTDLGSRFDRLEDRLEERFERSTQTIIAALRRPESARTRAED